MSETGEKPLPLRERNRLRTRGDILDAAAVLLGSEGFGGTTVEALSRNSGVSRGTIYAHFPGGREEIVQEVYQRIADAVNVQGVSLREGLDDPAARIAALATALVQATSAPEGRFYGVMGPDVVPVVSQIMGSTSRSFQALISQDLGDARAAGRLPEEAPVEALAAALVGAIRNAGAMAALEPEKSDQLVDAVRWLADGLLQRAAV
jgi:TetR/AcrR family transcriptional repressor of lmrAB and yxaGH operons